MKNIFNFFVCLFLFGCNNHNHDALIKIQGKTMGTYYSVIYVDEQNRDFKAEIDTLLGLINRSLSTYLPQSTISLINQSEKGSRIDPYFSYVFNASKDICYATSGKYDHTVMPLVNAWGFGFKKTSNLPDSSTIDSLKTFIGHELAIIRNDSCVKSHPGVMIDFSAIAKGFGVDEVGKLLESVGIQNYMVEIGGEVLAKGKKPDNTPWKIGIEKPIERSKPGNVAPTWVVSLNQKGLATSGNYRNFYEIDGRKYAHEIDPETGYPVEHNLLSVSVLADDCMRADAYATAFMVMGLEKSIQFINGQSNIDGLLIYADEKGELKTWMSPGFERIILP